MSVLIGILEEGEKTQAQEGSGRIFFFLIHTLQTYFIAKDLKNSQKKKKKKDIVFKGVQQLTFQSNSGSQEQ